MPETKQKTITELLEAAHLEFHHQSERSQDPIQFVHRYPAPQDQEVVALFASLLSYGNVRTILGSVEKILKPLGDTPAASILELNLTDRWKGFKHRFTTGEDIEVLAHWIRGALKSHQSLESFFTATQVENRQTIKPLLSSFVQRFTTQRLPGRLVAVAERRERNLKYLISDPERGSACKRLNMFLRWMVRPADGIDLGLWKSLSPEILVLPIDTHLLQTLIKLKWTKSATANWKVAEEATKRLRKICPEDPIRYDFALCHLSMNGKDIRKHYRSES